ncbi:Rab3 GTPase-activating protein catalytic subunit-domain-containing protein, partial [Dimargaris cristalligena]
MGRPVRVDYDTVRVSESEYNRLSDDDSDWSGAESESDHEGSDGKASTAGQVARRGSRMMRKLSIRRGTGPSHPHPLSSSVPLPPRTIASIRRPSDLPDLSSYSLTSSSPSRNLNNGSGLKALLSPITEKLPPLSDDDDDSAKSPEPARDLEPLAELESEAETSSDSEPEPEPIDLQREGHAYPSPNLTLLNSGETLWIPETQETPFMTEDLLQAQEEYLVELGTSPEAALQRAKIMSAELFSDMEAFKAANPGCVLGDFVRWHSPRDWVETETTGAVDGPSPMGNTDTDSPSLKAAGAAVSPITPANQSVAASPTGPSDQSPDSVASSGVTSASGGQLSLRMAEANNLWQQLWKEAQPVPVSRQTLLFDHNREAERVLQYLEQLSASDVFQFLLPPTFLLTYE